MNTEKYLTKEEHLEWAIKDKEETISMLNSLPTTQATNRVLFRHTDKLQELEHNLAVLQHNERQDIERLELQRHLERR